MAKSKTEIKSLAKLAKERLKNGFWEDCKEKVHESVSKAENEGENKSNVIKYYKNTVTRVIGEHDEESELFYQKVKYILDVFGDVSDMIGRLCDEEYMKTLSYQERERYISEVAQKYRIARERYDEEKKFERSQKGA